jgi:hypothetical protein
MILRPVSETVDALRGMLRESEENVAPRDDQSVATELEDILRHRIDDLEADEVLNTRQRCAVMPQLLCQSSPTN